jgi:hypothetical protein
MDQNYQQLFMDLKEYHPNEKAKTTANCVENQLTTHALCNENRERRPETRFQALLASVDFIPLEKVRPYDIQDLVKALKLRRSRKACLFDSIPNEFLGHLARK